MGVLALAASGCGLVNGGDGITREAVVGTVELGGKPLTSATIVFLPNNPNAPEVSSALIRDGKFSIPKENGPTAGRHEVRISAVAVGQVNHDAAPGMPSKSARETLPEKYNSASVLIAEIETGQPNEFVFRLDDK